MQQNNDIPRRPVCVFVVVSGIVPAAAKILDLRSLYGDRRAPTRPRARLGILSRTKMARFVGPGLAGKLRLLLKSGALIKEGSERMLHDILVDVIADREAG